jgi:hypothetical protein
MQNQIEETLVQYYGGITPQIDQVTSISSDPQIGALTLRWREVRSKRRITVKSFRAEKGLTLIPIT